jgi:hypothetical protein
MNTFYDEQWLQTLASRIALSTSLDLSRCEQVSDDGLRSLKCLASLTSLNMTSNRQVLDNELRSLAGLTALTKLDLSLCDQVSYDGMRSLAGLTAGGPLPLAGSSAGGFACDPLQLWPCFG